MGKHVFQTPARETSVTFQKLSYDVIGNCITQNGRNQSEIYWRVWGGQNERAKKISRSN